MVRISEARYCSDYQIWLRFSDGSEGIVDLQTELFGAVFEPLKDKAYFREVRLDPAIHTIVWPNGADFAPEFLHERLMASRVQA